VSAPDNELSHEPVAVLGAGSWGTALAIQFARAGHPTRLWSRSAADIAAMRAERCNRRYLPDAPFVNRLYGESNFTNMVVGAKIRFTGPNNPLGVALIPMYRWYLDKADDFSGFNQMQRGAGPGGDIGDFGLVAVVDGRLGKHVNVSANGGYWLNSNPKGLGDFVLSGGELPALALLDAVARLQPGVLGDAQSHEQDSFSDGLLDCPHYSRPEVLRDPAGERAVPAALLSGHHAEIARWRRQRSLELTATRRPDLIAAARAAGRLSADDEAYLAGLRL